MIDEGNAADRHSQPIRRGEFEHLQGEALAKKETENALKQFDRMVELIDDVLVQGAKFRLRPSHICDLNRLAVEGLIGDAGRFRGGGIMIGGSAHEPVEAADVPGLVDELCEYVNDNWGTKTPIHLAAYVMWRLNWIHPFDDGNGRTTRCVS